MAIDATTENRSMDVFEDRTEEFLKLLAEHSREIHTTIFRLVLNRNDADDIFQETNLVLWREFPRFETGTNFRAWAYRIAVNQVFAWKKRVQRDRLTFGSEFLQAVAERIDMETQTVEDRIEALSDCLARLPDHQRELIALRYGTQLDIEAIAEKKNRSVNAIYRALQRIRHDLLDCVGRKLSRPDAVK